MVWTTTASLAQRSLHQHQQHHPFFGSSTTILHMYMRFCHLGHYSSSTLNVSSALSYLTHRAHRVEFLLYLHVSMSRTLLVVSSLFSLSLTVANSLLNLVWIYNSLLDLFFWPWLGLAYIAYGIYSTPLILRPQVVNLSSTVGIL